MTLATERAPAAATPVRSGTSAALRRWSWRLFRREWRQQILVLLLLIVAVAATVAGTAIAANATPPSTTQFQLQGNDPTLSSDIRTLVSAAGGGTVVYDTTVDVPGTLQQIQVRSENPVAAIGLARVDVLRGHLPYGSGQVAMTAGVASALGVTLGQTWSDGGVPRSVVGLIRNPLDYSDQFALLADGQVTDPQQVTISVPPGASRVNASGIQFGIQATSTAGKAAAALIVLALSTLLLTFVGLIASAGFSVMAQRRLRALGLLASVGATDRQVRSVMLANGLLVGATAGILRVDRAGRLADIRPVPGRRGGP